ncbi:hypothetical protein GF420_11445 [candidate division GN15 bacterium]|nr:hypothetical protein [candidate division GN15 bacterium]
MKRLLLVLLAMMLAVPASAEITRVDVSPTVLVNLGNGHSGAAMGAAVTGDIFLSKAFAIRSTVGFTKDRYYPSGQDYSEAEYGFWLSVAPYTEVSVANTWRPYVALLGSFSSGGVSGSARITPTGMGNAPVARLQPAPTRANAYSFGATIGNKFRVSGPVSLYAEVTHFFYTSFAATNRVLDTGLPDVTFNYNWDENPTYLSLGLSYSFDLSD